MTKEQIDVIESSFGMTQSTTQGNICRYANPRLRIGGLRVSLTAKGISVITPVIVAKTLDKLVISWIIVKGSKTDEVEPM